MIIENNFIQGSELWHEARIDSIGGTGISKLITNSKGERSKSRDDYLLEKAGDIISRDTKPNFQSWEMKWGHKYEPQAIELFSFIQDVEVQTCAMIFYDEKRNWHISPDFFNENLKFGGEIKCPQLKEFKRIIDKGEFPVKHTLQCQAGLALTEFDHWWFVAFFPNLPPFIRRVERDESLIKIIRAEVNIFLRDLNNLIEEMKV